MSTQKEKFELFTRLQRLGFTYEEAQTLRRIEMTLSRWSEREANGEIQRDDATGKPYVYTPYRLLDPKDARTVRPIADRETAALARMQTLVDTRNKREWQGPTDPGFLWGYYQQDPRWCSLYLVTNEQLRDRPIRQAYDYGIAVTA